MGYINRNPIVRCGECHSLDVSTHIHEEAGERTTTRKCERCGHEKVMCIVRADKPQTTTIYTYNARDLYAEF